MTEELKPCPFCGGEAKLMYKDISPHNMYSDKRYFAKCDSCGSRGKKCKSIEKAIAAWNRRVSE